MVMTGSSERVAAAREAYARGEWSAARDGLALARVEGDLSTGDLERLGQAAWWLGDGLEAMAVAEDVYLRLVEDGAPEQAAMRALDLALGWAIRGDIVVSSGWLNRARRLLRAVPPGPVHGYLEYLDAGMALELDGDPGPAAAASEHVSHLGRVHNDPALAAFALVLSGIAAVRDGKAAEGFGDLDEAMLPVLAGRVAPLWSGDIFCSVIHLCHQVADLARMRAWTDALERWASPLSRTFMYAGVTRVHQLQLASAEGGWSRVESEIGEPSAALIGSHGWVAGAGFYELGEVRRLRGDTEGAELAYSEARALGVDPQPGHAMILFARGKQAESIASLRATIGQQGRLDRARLLLPAVELGLAAGDVELAESAGAELGATAAFYDTPGLSAWSHHAQACLDLADGRWREAVDHLEAAGGSTASSGCGTRRGESTSSWPEPDAAWARSALPAQTSPPRSPSSASWARRRMSGGWGSARSQEGSPDGRPRSWPASPLARATARSPRPSSSVTRR